MTPLEVGLDAGVAALATAFMGARAAYACLKRRRISFPCGAASLPSSYGDTTDPERFDNLCVL